MACELIRLGYGPKALYRVWRAIPPMKMDAVVMQVRDALMQIRRASTKTSSSWLIEFFRLGGEPADTNDNSA